MAEDTKSASRKKIQYATSAADDAPSLRRAIPYHRHSGKHEVWRDNPDNPLSPSFIPLTGRGERGKARWWALHARKQNRPANGEFDPK